MLLYLLCAALILIFLISLYSSITDIQKAEAEALESLMLDGYIKKKAKINKAQINNNHLFTDYFPESALDEKDDKKAEMIAFNWGVEEERKRQQLSQEHNGVYIEAFFEYEGKKYKTSRLSEYPVKASFELAKDIKNKSEKGELYVHIKKKTNEAFIIPTTKEQVSHHFNREVNKLLAFGLFFFLMTIGVPIFINSN